MFTGTYTAIVTPFKNGQLDEAALARLVKLQIKGGVDGIVPVGTTGESPTVDYEEHIRDHRAGREIRGGQSQGARRHRRQLHQRSHLPDEGSREGRGGRLAAGGALLQQADAGRTVSAFPRHRATTRSCPSCSTAFPAAAASRSPSTRSSAWPPTAKTSSASRKPAATPTASASCAPRSVPKFEILCGDDSLTLPFMSVGAQGVISVASNVAPRDSLAHGARVCRGDAKKALQCTRSFTRCSRICSSRPTRFPVKAALAMMGLIEEEYRLPLVPMSPKTARR